VNWQHFRAFLWLRWRLLLNQMRRGGTANVVLMTLLLVGAGLLAAALFAIFFLIGFFVLPRASPTGLMYVWDGLVVAFLFFWATGLIIELQRAEVLSLDKFLHLPVSLKGAFLINYLSSLFRFSLVVFLPSMLALALALVLVKGPALLCLFGLLAAFFLMITAITYQFQGWLAALMVNPRRRRTVIVVVTAVFVLLCQLPNLANMLNLWGGAVGNRAQVEQAIRLINLCLPPGWLPLGVEASAEGNFLVALLCTLGMGSLGAASLWRAYRTTLRMYTGQFSSGHKEPVAAVVPAKKVAGPVGNLLEKSLPWLSEQASAIALGAFRSLLRAPEAKMTLISPVLLLVIFGSMFMTRSVEVPLPLRPMPAFGAMAMILLCMAQLIGNQFGFDRSGFRIYVLSPAPRRDVLLGKNLAVAPLALGMGLIMVIVVQILLPMRLDHFLAMLPTGVSMYLLFCLLANWLSIFAPMAIRAGSLKPANTKLVPVLLQLVFAMLFPLVLAPALLPLGIEFVVEELGGIKGIPIFLLLSLLECAVLVVAYHFILSWQGSVLQSHEQKILNIVTTKAE
jgi:hypothetical protein